MEHAEDTNGSRSFIKFCVCGQGFSGADVQQRLDDHIANPNPESLGSLLIKLFNSDWANRVK